MLYRGKLAIGEWQKPDIINPNWESAIQENECFEKYSILLPGFSVDGVALTIQGKKIYIHLEKTFCNLCGHAHDWCAVPELTIGTSEYLELIDSLPELPCEACGKPLKHRGVIWRSQYVTGTKWLLSTGQKP